MNRFCALLLMFVIISNSSFVNAKTLIPQYSKIKVEYPGGKEFNVEDEITIELKKDFEINDKVIIPKGTKGSVKVTELMGSKNDKVKNAVGSIIAKDGTKIPIQMKRPKRRPMLKMLSIGTAVLFPVSYIVTELGAHKINRTALKSTYYVMDEIEIGI